jgi:hypothetical protein
MLNANNAGLPTPKDLLDTLLDTNGFRSCQIFEAKNCDVVVKLCFTGRHLAKGDVRVASFRRKSPAQISRDQSRLIAHKQQQAPASDNGVCVSTEAPVSTDNTQNKRLDGCSRGTRAQAKASASKEEAEQSRTDHMSISESLNISTVDLEPDATSTHSMIAANAPLSPDAGPCILLCCSPEVEKPVALSLLPTLKPPHGECCQEYSESNEAVYLSEAAATGIHNSRLDPKSPPPPSSASHETVNITSAIHDGLTSLMVALRSISTDIRSIRVANQTDPNKPAPD